MGSIQSSRSEAIYKQAHSIAHSGTQAALENPKDGRERLLFTNEARWNALTEKHTVDYCAWDHPYKKAENIWVSGFGWKLTGTTGNGRCNNDCHSGSLRPDTGRWRHFKVLSKDGITAVTVIYCHGNYDVT